MNIFYSLLNIQISFFYLDATCYSFIYKPSYDFYTIAYTNPRFLILVMFNSQIKTTYLPSSFLGFVLVITLNILYDNFNDIHSAVPLHPESQQWKALRIQLWKGRSQTQIRPAGLQSRWFVHLPPPATEQPFSFLTFLNNMHLLFYW